MNHNLTITNIILSFILIFTATFAILFGVDYYLAKKEEQKEKTIVVKDKTEEEIINVLESLSDQELEETRLYIEEGKTLPALHPIQSFTSNDIQLLHRILGDSINDAVIGAARESAHAYANAISFHIMKQILNDSSFPSNYESFTDTTIEVSGKKPTKIDVVIKQGSIVGGYMIVDGYKFIFAENGVATLTEDF